MELEAVLEILRAHRAELEAAGVVHAGVFGSVARGEAGPGSDVDIIVALLPDRVRTVYDYVGVKEQVAALFPGRVDAIDRDSMRPSVLANATNDAVYAF